MSAQQNGLIQHPPSHLHCGALSKECEAVEASGSPRGGAWSVASILLLTLKPIAISTNSRKYGARKLMPLTTENRKNGAIE